MRGAGAITIGRCVVRSLQSLLVFVAEHVDFRNRALKTSILLSLGRPAGTCYNFFRRVRNRRSHLAFSSFDSVTAEINRLISPEVEPRRPALLTLAHVALAAYVALGIILAITSGMWDGEPVLVVLGLSYAAFIACCVLRPQPARRELPHRAEGALALVLACCVVVLCVDPGLLHARDNVWKHCIMPVTACLAAASLMLAWASWRSRSSRWFLPVAGLGFACLIALRLLAIGASPDPWIDVFPINNQACDLIVAGENPYCGQYEDVYHGRYDYRPAFFYWPATLYFNVPFRQLLGDVRYGLVAADVLAAICLLLAARGTALTLRASTLVPLVWLAFPASLLVIEQAWIDPLLVLGAAATLVTLQRRRWWLCGIALGWTAATKQYAGLVGLMSLAWLAGRDFRATWRAGAAALATFAALMTPMIWWNPQAFYQSTIATYLDAVTRQDGLGIAALCLQHDIDVPRAVWSGIEIATIVSLCGCCALSRGRIDDLRRWAVNLAAVFWTCFLFGKFAFCNYYYFVAVLLLICFIASLPCASNSETSHP